MNLHWIDTILGSQIPFVYAHLLCKSTKILVIMQEKDIAHP